MTAHRVHFEGALSLRHNVCAGKVLVEYAVSSPQARHQFAVAVRLAQPSCVQQVQQEAITKNASHVVPPDKCCELILNLRAPKSAWRMLSDLWTLWGLKHMAATRLPWAHPICPEQAFRQPSSIIRQSGG